MISSSREVQGLEVSVNERRLAFSSLERKECPLKGSSARVAMRRTYQPRHCLATGPATVIALLRLAEGVKRLRTYLDELATVLQRKECEMRWASIFGRLQIRATLCAPRMSVSNWPGSLAVYGSGTVGGSAWDVPFVTKDT